VSYFSQAKPGREKGPAGVTATPASPGERTPVGGKTMSDTVSTFGPATLITGNIVCDGAVEIFGRVIGDIQAAQIAIGDGAQVEGNVTAHDVAVSGTFKGTVRGHNVKLKGSAKIDGEIYSKSLTVEENVQFEGISRRLDKPIELTSSAQVASTMQTAAPIGQPTLAPSGNGGKPFSVATPNSGSAPTADVSAAAAFSRPVA